MTTTVEQNVVVIRVVACIWLASFPWVVWSRSSSLLFVIVEGKVLNPYAMQCHITGKK